MVKITVDIGEQYQYAGALTAIEKLAQYDEGHEDEVNFAIDDIQNITEAANSCSRNVTSSGPVLEGYSKDKTLEMIDELKNRVSNLEF